MNEVNETKFNEFKSKWKTGSIHRFDLNKSIYAPSYN
jgi:hypothetical protein